MTTRLPRIAAWVVIVEGVFLALLMVASVTLNYNSIQETRQNREIGCISRYLDGAKYAPQCQDIIDDFVTAQ